MASQKTLLGAAGEHHIMTELLRRGYIAALAPRGAPNVDIVVSDVHGTSLCSIQVKTRRDLGSKGGWPMSAKHEKVRGDRLFYCFVNFGGTSDAKPIVYVLPAAVVAEVLAAAHRKYLSTPGKNGQPKESTMRFLYPDNPNNPEPKGWLDRYLNAWCLLDLEPIATDQAGES
jgi:hypothetical protein